MYLIKFFFFEYFVFVFLERFFLFDNFILMFYICFNFIYGNSFIDYNNLMFVIFFYFLFNLKLYEL